MKKTRNGGITLIALVITIIVLLILAGVSIAMLTGDNGILTQASNSQIRTEQSSVVEGMKLAVNEYVMEKETGETTSSFIDWLKEEGRQYINDDNEIQVSNLLGQSLSTGKGSGTNDVYKLEETTETASIASTTKVAAITTEENKQYEVVYYNNTATRTTLETISVSTTEPLEETDPSLFVVDDNGVISLKDYNDYYTGTKEWTIENVVIPSEVDGKKVTGIAGNIFVTKHPEVFNSIKSIIIPEGVEGIYTGSYWISFGNCNNLEKIQLPSSLKDIGSYAFSDCTSLTSITIPSSVTEMGHNVFSGWTKDQTIYVPFKEGELPEGWDEDWLGYYPEVNVLYSDD